MPPQRPALHGRLGLLMRTARMQGRPAPHGPLPLAMRCHAAPGQARHAPLCLLSPRAPQPVPPHTLPAAINEALATTKDAAKDPATIKDILAAASDRAMLKNAKPGAQGRRQASGCHVPKRARARPPDCPRLTAPPTLSPARALPPQAPLSTSRG
jgi:hypothetical protein